MRGTLTRSAAVLAVLVVAGHVVRMPFYTLLQENMAALLRSARLLRLSPSGLLHVAGTNRTGPPLGRLYSGALCGSRTAACSRLSRPGSDSVSIRYHAAC